MASEAKVASEKQRVRGHLWKKGERKVAVRLTPDDLNLYADQQAAELRSDFYLYRCQTRPKMLQNPHDLSNSSDPEIAKVDPPPVRRRGAV